MKQFFWLVIIAVLIFSACAKDIIVKPPEGLRGYYVGEFKVEENVGSSGGLKTTIQYVNWTFSDQKYWCNVDTLHNISIEMCNFYGSYQLETEVIFTFEGQEPGTCLDIFQTEGGFSLIKITDENDVETITLSQNEGVQPALTRKTITLEKQTE